MRAPGGAGAPFGARLPSTRTRPSAIHSIARPREIPKSRATVFITGFFNEIPTGALLLVSDQPMVPEGVKTTASDQIVTDEFAELHLRIGIDSLSELINQGLTVKHLRF